MTVAQGDAAPACLMLKVHKTHKNTPETRCFRGEFGGDYWTRTSDLMRVKHAL